MRKAEKQPLPLMTPPRRSFVCLVYRTLQCKLAPPPPPYLPVSSWRRRITLAPHTHIYANFVPQNWLTFHIAHTHWRPPRGPKLNRNKDNYKMAPKTKKKIWKNNKTGNGKGCVRESGNLKRSEVWGVKLFFLSGGFLNQNCFINN